MKPDHKKLGQELDLFCFSDLVGSGLPLWTPKGTIIRNLLDDFVWQLRQKHDYQQVDIPHLTKKDLYVKSGHWDKFQDELFQIKTREGHMLALKPMNCPHHIEIFDRRPHSWRELPQRYASTTKVYRDEQTGELNGLSRVRSITQDDAHVFCRKKEVIAEMEKIWDIVKEFYSVCGFQKLMVGLSLRDPDHPEKYIGENKLWEEAESQLDALIAKKREDDQYITFMPKNLGEAAFYGPKIDFVAQDSLEREWQVATIQLDLNLPERFDLTCINEQGEKEPIAMIHCAIMGSIERYLAVLLEHFNGALPLWLSPVQVVVLPISEKLNDYGRAVANELLAAGLRTEFVDKNETIGKKIRDAETQKIPYIVVVGEKEETGQTVAVRKRKEGDLGEFKIADLIQHIQKEIAGKTI